MQYQKTLGDQHARMQVSDTPEAMEGIEGVEASEVFETIEAIVMKT